MMRLSGVLPRSDATFFAKSGTVMAVSAPESLKWKVELALGGQRVERHDHRARP